MNLTDTEDMLEALEEVLDPDTVGETDLNADCLLGEAHDFEEIVRVATFREEGVLTNDDGLVVVCKDGGKFHITVQYQPGDDKEDEEIATDETRSNGPGAAR